MGLLSQKGLHVLKVLKFSNGPAKITIIRFSHFRLSARYAVSKFDIFSCLLVHKTKAGYCEQQRLRADHTSPGKLPHCLLHSRVCPPSPSCLQNVTVYRFHCIHFSSPGEIGWASFLFPMIYIKPGLELPEVSLTHILKKNCISFPNFLSLNTATLVSRLFLSAHPG